MRLFTTSLFVLLSVSPVIAEEHVCLRIQSPGDQGKITDTSKITVEGTLNLPDGQWQPDSFKIRARLIRPLHGELFVSQEVAARVERVQAEERVRHTYRFECHFEHFLPPSLGDYIVRVDCIDQREHDKPTLATHSVFVRFVLPDKSRQQSFDR